MIYITFIRSLFGIIDYVSNEGGNMAHHPLFYCFFVGRSRPSPPLPCNLLSIEMCYSYSICCITCIRRYEAPEATFALL